ncbi:MAG TPA: TIGR04053 family radical SAM/SPASM domain-containing protein [Candidatus Binataceae bacterium]|nr:TIGR04053 family radical SAM/SPASM domain-containing protein [Candidatus Binataceae bacterium]
MDPRLNKVRHPTYNLNERPFLVIWEVTRACDLACKHCRAEAMPVPDPRQLTTADSLKLIDQVASFGPPPPLFVLTGGDPMKRADLMDLISYASSQGVPVAFSPSVTPLLTPDSIARLKEAGAKALSLSLDGAEASVHDGFRGVAGTFDRTMKIWQAARECELKVQINSTVTRLNLSDLPAMAHAVKELGALTWSVFFLVPVGRGVNLGQLSPDECEDVMNFLYDVGTVVPTKTTEGHHFKRVFVERTILDRRGDSPEKILHLGPTYRALRTALEPWPQIRPGARRTPMDVNAAKGFVFISHIGAVCPSGFFPVAVDNVRMKPLPEIYRESALFRRLRDPARLLGRCGRCEFQAVCAGSRSRAFGVTGNGLEEDPLCGYQPGSFPYQRDVAEMIEAAARPAPFETAHA